MKHGYILSIDEMRAAIAGHYSVSINDVAIQAFPEGNHLRIQALVMEGEKKIEEKPQAYWEYWGGWAGNHDKRIDDAKCSNCGFKHPTVRGGNAPDQLYKLCPHCGRYMGHKEV